MQEQHLQVFKNGFSLVTRVFSVPAAADGWSTFSLGTAPEHASLGTVWVEPAKGCEIKALTRADATKPKSCTSIPEILKANTGQQVEIVLGATSKDEGSKTLKGVIAEVLLPSSEGGGLLILTSSEGQAAMVPLGVVVEARAVAAKLKTTVDGKMEATGKTEWSIEYKGPGGNFVLQYLRKGITWAPSYHWDIKRENQLCHLCHTATLINESEEEGEFKTLSCVVGFPNMKNKDISDPMASKICLQDFLTSLSTGQDLFNAGEMPVPQAVAKAVPRGYGGAATYAAPMMQMAAPMASYAPPPAGADDAEDSTADADTDVHLYTFNGVSLPSQSRMSLPVFDTTAAFKDVYRCKSTASGNACRGPDDDNVLDVWHALQVTNATEKPWTTGPIMITNAGQYQCGSQMFYTSVKSEALVEMTKALAVKVKHESTTVPAPVEEALGKKWSVTFQTTVFTLENSKPVEIQLVLDAPGFGEIVSSDPPLKKKVEKKGYGFDRNMNYNLQWELQVPARDTKLVTIKMKSYQALRDDVKYVSTFA